MGRGEESISLYECRVFAFSVTKLLVDKLSARSHREGVASQ
jgi:hypothetical protein